MLGWSPTAIKFAALYERLFALICTLDDNGFGSGFGPVKVTAVSWARKCSGTQAEGRNKANSSKCVFHKNFFQNLE
jgi:hypothetical protein